MPYKKVFNDQWGVRSFLLEHNKPNRPLTTLLLEAGRGGKWTSFCCDHALWCEIQSGSLRTGSRAGQVTTQKPPVDPVMLPLAALRRIKSSPYFPHPHVCYGIGVETSSLWTPASRSNHSSQCGMCQRSNSFHAEPLFIYSYRQW